MPRRRYNPGILTILLSAASDLISSEKIVLQPIRQFGEVAEPIRLGTVSRRALDRTPLRSWRLRLPVATLFDEAQH